MNWENNDTIRSDWNFDTVNSTSVMGTFSSAAKDLMPDMDDEEMLEDTSIYEEDQGALDTTASIKGTVAFDTPIAVNKHAGNSTVRIHVVPEDHDSLPLDPSGDPTGASSAENPGPITPCQSSSADALGAPPAYSSSTQSTRRSSYAARHRTAGAGTIMREADLGTGLGTIRPIKKVDTASSLRLSAEYVGTARSKEGAPLSPTSPPTSPVKERSSHGRRISESERAGRAMVDDVVLPVLQKVGLFFLPRCLCAPV